MNSQINVLRIQILPSMKLKYLIICSVVPSILLASCAEMTDQQRRILTGAGIGGTAGAIIGNQRGRSLEGGVIGAGLGGVLGGLLGQNQNNDNGNSWRQGSQPSDRRSNQTQYYQDGNQSQRSQSNAAPAQSGQGASSGGSPSVITY